MLSFKRHMWRELRGSEIILGKTLFFLSKIESKGMKILEIHDPSKNSWSPLRCKIPVPKHQAGLLVRRITTTVINSMGIV